VVPGNVVVPSNSTDVPAADLADRDGRARVRLTKAAADAAEEVA
jgi:hypothetical protein